MGRPVYREHHRRRLLPDGKALRGDVVKIIRGRRRLEDYGAALEVDESTIRRWEREGAKLVYALAMATLEWETGNTKLAAYVLDMIGESGDRNPTWAHVPPRKGQFLR